MQNHAYHIFRAIFKKGIGRLGMGMGMKILFWLEKSFCFLKVVFYTRREISSKSPFT